MVLLELELKKSGCVLRVGICELCLRAVFLLSKLCLRGIVLNIVCLRAEVMCLFQNSREQGRDTSLYI